MLLLGFLGIIIVNLAPKTYSTHEGAPTLQALGDLGSLGVGFIFLSLLSGPIGFGHRHSKN